MSEWQPIETAPKKTEVLGWFPYSTPGLSKPGCCLITIFLSGYGDTDDPDDRIQCWRDPYDLDPAGSPTHWMPLPEPPI